MPGGNLSAGSCGVYHGECQCIRNRITTLILISLMICLQVKKSSRFEDMNLQKHFMPKDALFIRKLSHGVPRHTGVAAPWNSPDTPPHVGHSMAKNVFLKLNHGVPMQKCPIGLRRAVLETDPNSYHLFSSSIEMSNLFFIVSNVPAFTTCLWLVNIQMNKQMYEDLFLTP